MIPVAAAVAAATTAQPLHADVTDSSDYRPRDVLALALSERTFVKGRI